MYKFSLKSIVDNIFIVVGGLIIIFAAVVLSYGIGQGFKKVSDDLLAEQERAEESQRIANEQYQLACEESAKQYNGEYPVISKHIDQHKVLMQVGDIYQWMPTGAEDYYIYYGYEVEGYPNRPVRVEVEVSKEVYNSVDTSCYYNPETNEFTKWENENG